MKDQWSRQIEAERRLARSESELRRLASQLSGIRQSVRTQAQNPSKPVQGGSGGGIGFHRFAVTYTAWVEWDTVPTLKTGASSNPTADVTSLANAVSEMETGFTLSLASLNSPGSNYWYDSGQSKMIAIVTYRFESPTSVPWTVFTRISKYDGGNFLADPKITGSGSTIDSVNYGAETNSSQVYRILLNWNRRNGIGSVIGTDTLTARRTIASASSFASGPTYGESGTWSFAMECPATTYSNAGSGTIYLRWGEPLESIYSGGSPDDLPADAFDGGSPASLPADIIDGGTI